MRLCYKIVFVTLHILMMPLHVNFLLILFIYKQIVQLVAKISNQNFVEPITGQDSVFLTDKIWSRPHCSIVVGLDLNGSPTEEETTQLFQKVYDLKGKDGRICFRELGYNLVRFMGYGFWKEASNFNIRDRIHSLNREVMTQNDEASSTTSSTIHEEPITSLVEGLLRQPYELEQPLWDVYLLHNYQGFANRTLAILRFHHVMGDGLSFVKLFYALTGVKTIPSTSSKPAASFERWNKIQRSRLVKFWSFLTLITVGFVDYVYELLFAKDRNCLQFTEKGKLKLTGNWVCSLGKKVDLAELKKISTIYGCSLVHMLLTGISNGLERYFHKYHEREESPKGFHFFFPAPLPNHPDLLLENFWCLAKLFAKFGIKSIAEKLEYFKAACYHCASVSTLPITSAFTFKFVNQYLPSALIALGSKSKGASTVVLSNVVGPQDSWRLGESIISDKFFFMPICHESMGLAAGIVSCNGGARICLTADLGCIPDRCRLEDLNMMMHDELLEMCDMRKITEFH